MSKPLTPCIRYLRVSGQSQSHDDRYGFARQRRSAERCEQKHGLEMVLEVSDVISGASESRTGLDSLPAVAARCGAQAVSLPQVDRLSRAEFIAAYKILGAIISTGLDVYADDLRTRVNVRDPESVREVNRRLEAAYEERHRTRTRVYDGLLAKAERGLTRRPLSLYGYLDGEIFEPQAIWVRRAYELALQFGTPAVADALNLEGARTAGGKFWHYRGVSDLLKNPTYKGESGFGRELFCPECRETRQGHQRDVERGHGYCARCGGVMTLNRVTIAVPAIVSPETWEGVKEAMHARNVKPGRRGKRLHIYALTGRITCGLCGSAMSGMSNNLGYHYYRCGASKRVAPGRVRCEHRANYRHETMHEAVLQALHTLIERPEIIQETLNALAADPHQQNRARAEAKREILQAKLARIEEGYLGGALSLETALKQRRETEAELRNVASYPLPKKQRVQAGQLLEQLETALVELPLAELVTQIGVRVVVTPPDDVAVYVV